MRHFTPNITPKERKAMMEYYNRVIDMCLDKLQYLPEEHKADIRKVLEENE